MNGGRGVDTLEFNGANAAENITMSAQFGLAFFKRDVANVTMTLSAMERIEFTALGGADNITVQDLSSAGVTQVALDLAGTLNGELGDGAVDRVTVEGRKSADAISISTAGTTTHVLGGPTNVDIEHADSNDQLVVQGLAGNDTIDAAAMAAGVMNLTVDAGDGDDTIVGSAGADTLLGGAGNDVVDGARGNDVAFLGAGDDTFVWDPGEGSDVVEGQAGFDTLLFNGANVAENIAISANGERATFFRDVANITMDLNDVEQIDFNALGGADNIVINDLSGTDVNLVRLSLIGGAGLANDGLEDSITVNATAADDVIVASSNDDETIVTGTPADVAITGVDAGLDKLRLNGGAGDDVIDASLVTAAGPALVLDGGDGDDVIIGGAGDNLLIGGLGDDTLIGGAGDDIFLGGEIVSGFETGMDQLDLRAIADGQGVDWVLARAHDIGGNVIFDFGDESLILMDQTVGALGAGDFLV